MLYDWEGNRRSGVALAMGHRPDQGPWKGDEHPTNYTPVTNIAHFSFTVLISYLFYCFPYVKKRIFPKKDV